MVRAIDNKDRWIATVDLANAQAAAAPPPHRSGLDQLGLQRFRLAARRRTLWFLSEESGYSHLYVQPTAARRAR